MSLSEPCSSSNKRQENGDVLSEAERPLKKARFAWQVKGRYHLKKELNEVNPQSINNNVENNNTEPPPEPEELELPPDNKHVLLRGNTEENLEILGDYLLKQDFQTLSNIPGAPSMHQAMSMTFNPFPSICGYKIQGIQVPRGYPTTLPMLTALLKENRCIAQWQSKQTARGYVDNTINRVLESWLMSTNRDGSLAVEFADFLNNLPDSNSVEDEGILMAISAHGLNTNRPTIIEPRTTRQLIDEMCSDISDEELTIDGNEDLIAQVESRYLAMRDNNQVMEPLPSSSSRYSESKIQDEGRSEDSLEDEDGSTTGPDPFIEPEFMNEAVSYAIQNIGLASHSTD